MSLRIYNTLSRALEAFSPLEPGHVRMYVCGMTVYDLCHLGHARSMVAEVVHRHATDVHAHMTRLDRRKRFQCTRQRVVDTQTHES